MILELKRIKSLSDRTYGVLFTNCYEIWATLELPWKDNQHDISCIPPGTYKIDLETHAKFGKCYRLAGVPDRAGILIHVGNYPSDTKGCIILGETFITKGVGNSRDAIQRLIRIAGANATLVIS